MIECCINRRNDVRTLQFQKLHRTWRTPVEKAAGADPEEQYQWLHDIADSQLDTVRKAFLAAIDRIRGTVKQKELEAAIATGSVEKVVAVLDLDRQIADAIRVDVLPTLEDATIEAGRQAPAASMPKGGELRMRFDLANPNATKYLQSYDFNLIKQISDDTRTAVRGVVQNAFANGGHPYEQAKQIKEMIGLTDKQAQSVANFRRMLEEGDRGALTRALRDKRHDPVLRRALGELGEGLDQDQIETMVGRYANNALKARAETIARTETINAAQAGQQLSWEQAAQKGFFERTKVRQGWLVTPDDRLCIWCAVVPEMNIGGVPLGGYFKTPLGPVLRPTLHPQCRCSLYLMAF